MDDAEKARFRRALRAWYRKQGRHGLPWRLTRDPYAVLVSEVMLQQTQVDRVVPYYREWLDRWPTLTALADVSAADVIRAWSGLGYNRRALNLHRAAQVSYDRHGGTIPKDVDSLLALPGVGAYTASAVACFAADAAVSVVDTNIARVLGRVVEGRGTVGASEARKVLLVAQDLLPKREHRDWNLALMDLGAMICTARAPRCDVCPVTRHCRWFNGPDSEPATLAPPTKTPRFETTARFARGCIVEHLRNNGPSRFSELNAALPPPHAAKLPEYLAGLEKDGLVELRGELVMLPGELPTEG